MKKYNHVMLDIETLGNKPYSVIISVGAVEFDMHTNKIGKTFYMKVDPESCTKAGLIMNADTVMWWMQQNDLARGEFKKRHDMYKIERVLNDLTKFFKSLNKDVSVWANSPSFDCNLLDNAYERVLGTNPPWSHRQSRDYRTIVAMYPAKSPTAAEMISHKAVDDCLWQINNLRLAVKSLGIMAGFK